MKIQLLAIMTLFILASCSSNKSVDNEVETQDEAIGLENENMYESDEGIAEDQYSDDTIEEKSFEDEQYDDSGWNDQAPAPTFESSAPTGDESFYTVEKGDTFMLIAYKLYGDYSQWKSIQNLNPEISPAEGLKEGTQIKIIQPTEAFSWQKQGNPYLIKRNDTLRKISYSIYNTASYWDHLYEHNKPLIKDPNIIFAGFTIFYLNAEELNRDPANSMTDATTPEPTQIAEEVRPYQEPTTFEEMTPAVENSEEMVQATPTEVVEEAQPLAEEPMDSDMEMDSEFLDEPEALEFEE